MLFLPKLPDNSTWWLMAGITLLLAIFNNKITKLMALVMVTALWAISVGHAVLQPITQYSEKKIQIKGVVQTVNLGKNEDKSTLFLVEQVEQKNVSPFLVVIHGMSSLEPILAGQRWQVHTYLNPIHSRLNEGGFDRQRWAVANRQVLMGKVIKAQRIDNKETIRQHYISSQLQKINDFPHLDVLTALAFGERGLLNNALKQLFQLTGTAHLMAISGLHISLAALLGFMIARVLQGVFPLQWITPTFPMLLSVLAALSYVWLSGANPPALRAGWALLIWCYLRYRGYFCSGWQVWLHVVALLLLLDPLMILSDSFWLSCCAVAGLLFWYQWMPLAARFAHGWKWVGLRLLHLQLGILWLLAPLQILLFQGVSLGSLVANLWAVPLVSFVSVPLILLALLLSELSWISSVLWKCADLSIQWVLWPLPALEKSWIWLDSQWLVIGLLTWFALPVYRFGWWRYSPVSVALIAVLVVQMRLRQTDATWRMTMLDVGHGLAVVIERNGKALLYDTGNKWEEGSMAKSEILPYLHWRGLILEEVVISHQHQDHVGGLAEILHEFPQVKLRSSSFSLPSLACQKGVTWNWQALTIEVLWPSALTALAENPQSCVLKISDGRHSVLLTGDLEKQQEQQVVADLRAQLKVDVLQVPHHGSRTSSSHTFLQAASPELAVASVARYNPWHLPAKQITQRYQQTGIEWRDTAHAGQIAINFSPEKWAVSSFREQLKPRWYHPWFGSD